MTPNEPPLTEAGRDRWAELDGEDRAKPFAAPERFLGGWPVAAQVDVLIEAQVEVTGGEWPDEDKPAYAAAQAAWLQILQSRGAAPGFRPLRDAEFYLLIPTAAARAGRWEEAWPTVQFY